MNTIQIQIRSAADMLLAESKASDRISLVYTEPYQQGDKICLKCSAPGFYEIHLEDTLASAVVYLAKTEITYVIPWGEQRTVFSPRNFAGDKHLLRARWLEEVPRYRNLALNPYDRHDTDGMYPHASANVETRGEAVFAAYNAIDGMYENCDHGPWPYQSWGINRDPNAQWTLHFGRAVCLNEIRLTIRADFPHDSWWEEVTVAFSDGTEEQFSLVKTERPQSFAVNHCVEWLTLKNLKKANDESPFPALTQFEAWGSEKS